MKNFDFISFIIGLLLGMIITLLLVWIAYYSRTFLFTYCPYEPRLCGSSDYYRNPSEALAMNSQLKTTDILQLDGSGHTLLYNRVIKNTDCTPSSNEVVPITFPQFCTFTDISGDQFLYKNKHFGSGIYVAYDSDYPNEVITNGNCDPIPGTSIIAGTPVVKWI